MKKLTREVIQQMRDQADKPVAKDLSAIYLKVLDTYVAANYPNGATENTLMCSIHNEFTKGHNCVACNLNVHSTMLMKYLMGYKGFEDVNLASTNFHLLLYLMVERYHEYFKILDLQESYRLKNFSVFQRIVYWANFLKHPKAFMLAHHAFYWIRGVEYNSEQWFYDTIEKANKDNKIIDDAFVKEYYSGDKNNPKLYKLLSKKEDYVVVFPDPVKLTEEFVIAQAKFVSMIRENEIVRVILESKATISEYFSAIPGEKPTDQD